MGWWKEYLFEIEMTFVFSVLMLSIFAAFGGLLFEPVTFGSESVQIDGIGEAKEIFGNNWEATQIAPDGKLTHFYIDRNNIVGYFVSETNDSVTIIHQQHPWLFGPLGAPNLYECHFTRATLDRLGILAEAPQ